MHQLTKFDCTNVLRLFDDDPFLTELNGDHETVFVDFFSLLHLNKT